tara:strand:- start:2751 stop:3254 length:504 start_codon:yes stop_codon:yes gene_type:complete
MTLTSGSSNRIVTALVEDKPGVLARISGMFRRRGFNIASLVVGQCELPNKSRMTFVVEGNDRTVEQVTKHLYKLIEVIKVNDISEQNIVERELALIRVKTNPQTRSEIMQIVDIFRAHIVDVANDVTIVEVTGNEHKVNSLQKLLEPFGILEVMRTGTIATNRGLQK